MIVDLALSQRLERTEAVANAKFVEARARLNPGSGAEWIEAAGAYAMFDGVESPCTQTFGLGVFAVPSADDLNRVESFFRDRGAAVFHEISPLVEFPFIVMLQDRGYRIVEMTSLLCLPLDGPHAKSAPSNVRLVPSGTEREVWIRTAVEGWSESEEYAHLVLDLMRVHGANDSCLAFLAEVDGQPAAAGAMVIHDGVALLAGASTVPRFRRRGAQRALLDARLAYAQAAGCDVAMMGAAPGSGSQRNAQRVGFQVAYTRLKWMLAG